MFRAPSRPVLLVLIVLAAALSVGFAAGALAGAAAADDVRERTKQYMDYERTIKLDARQEAVKRTALEALPAPCCSDNSAYTCCCPCNLSRTIWGLANHLIAEQSMDAKAVRAEVVAWIEEIGPEDFPGDTCYTAGGCGKPFAKAGCGGMAADHVVF